MRMCELNYVANLGILGWILHTHIYIYIYIKCKILTFINQYSIYKSRVIYILWEEKDINDKFIPISHFVVAHSSGDLYICICINISQRVKEDASILCASEFHA